MAFFGCNGSGDNLAFARHIARFTGETVTIFTTSGGASGCGFTGFLIAVNCNFVRLVTDMGEAPASPLAENICPNLSSDDFPTRGITGNAGGLEGGRNKGRGNRFGSVCDIPIDKIAAFCHNAV